MTFVLWLAASAIAHAATPLPQQSLVPGGVALVRIDGPAEDPPSVTLGTAPAMVLRQDDHWLAVVGIPLGAAPGKLTLAVDASRGHAVDGRPRDQAEAVRRAKAAR